MGTLQNGGYTVSNTADNGAADISFSYGTSGDIPIAGHWYTGNSTCPWNGIQYPATGTPISCTYTYNRQQALNYALKYAQQANPIFCKYRYYGTSSNCAGSSAAALHFTDCANFVSQAILSGDLITVKAIHYSGIDTPNWYVYFNNNYQVYQNSPADDSPWAGADTNQLPAHFVNLGGVQIGQRNDPLSTIVPPNPNFNTVTPPVPTPNTVTASYIAQVEAVAGTTIKNAGIEQGDILYLNNASYPNPNYNPKDPNSKPTFDGAHTVLIAGWGEALTSWADYAAEEPLLLQGIGIGLTATPGGSPKHRGLFATYNEACMADPACVAGTEQPVPYIIDHGPTGDAAANPNGTSLFVYPRPYYMLWWSPPTNGVNDYSNRLYFSGAIAGNIVFLHMPDSLTFVATPSLNPPYTATYMLSTPPLGLNQTQLFNGQLPITLTPTP